MINDPLKANVLSCRFIPKVKESLAKELDLPPGHHSIGIFTADSDDVAYAALDEATKKTDITVVYAKSFYGGAANANSPLAGEVIGIISGPDPSEVKTALDAINHIINSGAISFISANDDDSIAYFAHCVNKTGSYLSNLAQVDRGTSLAYLIAPPAEAIYALDLALKTADVEIAVFYGPPSETNYGGALLKGSQSACEAACCAFAQGVKEVARRPISG